VKVKWIVFGALLLAPLDLTPTAAGAPAPKPNILIILADDLSYADVGFNGCKDIPIPNIDKLATSGFTFRTN
jgi:arylsulfatase A-like enzyme